MFAMPSGGRIDRSGGRTFSARPSHGSGLSATSGEGLGRARRTFFSQTGPVSSYNPRLSNIDVLTLVLSRCSCVPIYRRGAAAANLRPRPARCPRPDVLPPGAICTSSAVRLASFFAREEQRRRGWCWRKGARSLPDLPGGHPSRGRACEEGGRRCAVWACFCKVLAPSFDLGVNADLFYLPFFCDSTRNASSPGWRSGVCAHRVVRECHRWLEYYWSLLISICFFFRLASSLAELPHAHTTNRLVAAKTALSRDAAR